MSEIVFYLVVITQQQVMTFNPSTENMCWAACRDLGAHIDGFVATAAHTLVVQADEESAVTGKAADVISAANTALEAAIRLIKPGKKISEVSLLPSSETLSSLRSGVRCHC